MSKFSISFKENFIEPIFLLSMTAPSKARIAEIALEEFLRNGVRSITIKQLTQLTGVSSKTIYKLFKDKKNLLRTCLDIHYSQISGEFLQLRGTNAIETILKMFYYTIELEFKISPKFYHDLNAYYPNLQDEVLDTYKIVIQKFIGLVQQGMKSGLFLPNINPGICLIACQHLYNGITREKLYDSLNMKGPELIRNTVLTYLRGICTPNGLKKLEQLEQSIAK